MCCCRNECTEVCKTCVVVAGTSVLRCVRGVLLLQERVY